MRIRCNAVAVEETRALNYEMAGGNGVAAMSRANFTKSYMTVRPCASPIPRFVRIPIMPITAGVCTRATLALSHATPAKETQE